MNILVASNNPIKINATLEAFRALFPDEPCEVTGTSYPSDVADQPLTDTETLLGASNRALNASKAKTADYYVGIEGGIEDKDGIMQAFHWVVVRSSDGRIGQARSGSFALPPAVGALIQQGMGLGEADDIVFGKTNSKQQHGAIGLLTHNVIDRTSFCKEAVILALIPFKNPTLY